MCLNDEHDDIIFWKQHEIHKKLIDKLIEADKVGLTHKIKQDIMQLKLDFMEVGEPWDMQRSDVAIAKATPNISGLMNGCVQIATTHPTNGAIHQCSTTHGEEKNE